MGSLRGRKFHGVFDATRHEYRVAIRVREGDDAAALGWETETLPGGRYAQVRLQGDPPAPYEPIASTFEPLATRSDRDPSRQGVAFYRRYDVIDLLLPVSYGVNGDRGARSVETCLNST